MKFVINLQISKNEKNDGNNLILIIIDRLTKIIY